MGDGGECSRKTYPIERNVQGKKNVAETGHRPWVSAWVLPWAWEDLSVPKSPSHYFIVNRHELTMLSLLTNTEPPWLSAFLASPSKPRATHLGRVESVEETGNCAWAFHTKNGLKQNGILRDIQFWRCGRYTHKNAYIAPVQFRVSIWSCDTLVLVIHASSVLSILWPCFNDWFLNPLHMLPSPDNPLWPLISLDRNLPQTIGTLCLR